jgi:hypothetical protein
MLGRRRAGPAARRHALACRDGERLRFGYTDSQGIPSRRHVEPYRMVFTDRRWCLVARGIGKGDWRSFRLDRLDNPLATGQRSSPADPPDAARFVAEGIAAGAYRYQARVLVPAPADVVAARMPGLGAVVEAVSESACLVISGHHYLDARSRCTSRRSTCRSPRWSHPNGGSGARNCPGGSARRRLAGIDDRPRYVK